MAYKILGANVSPFVRKCRALCAEKNISYEYEAVSPFNAPAGYRDISPLGKIPAFLDGDKALADSSVICQYLERCNPTPALYPSDNYAFARALWFEEFMDSGFIPVAGPQVFRPLLLTPMMSKQPLTKETKAEAMKVVENSLYPLWDYLEKEIGNQQFFVEDRFSIADIAIATGHVNLRHAAVEPSAARWPKVAAFLARVYARPSFAALLAEEATPWDQREKIAAV